MKEVGALFVLLVQTDQEGSKQPILVLTRILLISAGSEL
jgi:hypothetical protein